MIPGIRSASLALVCLAACTQSEEAANTSLLEAPGHPSVIFLTLNEPQQAVMDALLDGVIVRDDAGCLRHATEDYTLVWPLGYTLVAENDEFVVRDHNGEVVGRIGERFRLGGGVLLFLHDGMTMSAQARELAERECPGQYWIVGAPVRP